MSSANIPIIDLKAKELESFSAPASLFAAEKNENVLHFVIKGQLFRYYKKTATVKPRSAVSGGGKKIRKQKGSGSSRQGGNRGPQWVGGGVAFGPSGVKRNFKVNKKMRQQALATVLTDRLESGQLKVLRHSSDKPQTKPMAQFVQGSFKGARVAFVVANDDVTLGKSVRNMKRVDLLTTEKWTPYDFVKADTLIFSENAIKQLTKKYAAEVKA